MSADQVSRVDFDSILIKEGCIYTVILSVIVS